MKYLMLAALLIPTVAATAGAVPNDSLIPEIQEFGQEVRTTGDSVSANGREKFDTLSSRVNALETRANESYNDDKTWKKDKRGIQKELKKLRRDFRDFRSDRANLGETVQPPAAGTDSAPVERTPTEVNPEERTPTQDMTHPAPRMDQGTTPVTP